MTNPDTTQAEAPPEPRPFATFLITHAKGRSHDELSEKLRELVLAVEDTGKAGKLSYTLTIKPQPNVAGAVLVADTITSTLPALSRPESIFFATPTGDLVRHDPRQTNLFDPENH